MRYLTPNFILHFLLNTRSFKVFPALVYFLILFYHTTGWPAPGDLDISFDGNGVVVTDLEGTGSPDSAHAVALQPDGKILVAGIAGTNKFGLVRYLTTGSMDVSFGTNGVITTTFPDRGWASDMALQLDGRILLTGSSSDGEFAVVRYLPDGELDASFDTDGIVATAFETGLAYANSIALQVDGKAVVVGHVPLGNVDSDFAIVRYNIDGSLDASFDGDGKLTTTLTTQAVDVARAVAIQPDHKIVVAGETRSDFGVVRYNSDGSLDNGFGNNGIVVSDISAVFNSGLSDSAHAIALQADGKILVAGTAGHNNADRGLAVIRYNSDGTMDSSFGGAGIVVTTLEGLGWEQASSIVVQPDGKIVIAGYYVSSELPSDLDLAIVRYNSDGSLDSSFHSDGVATLNLGSVSDHANGLAVQSDGKLLVAGHNQDDFVIVRYEGFSLDLTPTTFSFTDELDVEQTQIQTSGLITVNGLDSNVKVPVSVNGGEYAMNGATSYTTGINWIGNDDLINVRHTSASDENTTVNTVLSIGGLMAPNGIIHLGTNETVKDTYSTTTSTTTSTVVATDGGGGSMNWLFLIGVVTASVRFFRG